MDTIIKIHPDPPIRTYLHYAHPNGIVLANPERQSWLLNHYAQLKYVKADNANEPD